MLASAAAVLVGSIVAPQVFRGAEPPGLLASVPDPLPQGGDIATLPEEQLPWNDASAMQAPAPAGAAVAPATEAPAIMPAVTARPTNTPSTVLTRVPRPVLTGPRRVGIQAGHWLTGQAPPELRGLLTQTGTSWNGISEVGINLDIAERIKRLLEPKGIAVDILPTTIPPSYLADAFVALHGDGDTSGVRSGFKLAYSTRRTPYESALLDAIRAHYGAATGLAYDQAHVSRNMLGYYAMAWTRNRYSTAPHTPSVILEMGYVTHDHDRHLMMNEPDLVAGGIAEGIVRFLDAHPRDKLFGSDLLIQLPAPRGTPTPRP